MKKAITTTLVLKLPDPDKPYRVITDASDYIYVGILEQQDKEARWHPVAFLSKKMTPMEENYDIHDKELLAVIRATEFWRHLLEGAKHPFEIWTDHKNLLYFAQVQTINCRQAQWALWLTRFDYTILYKLGITN